MEICTFQALEREETAAADSVDLLLSLGNIMEMDINDTSEESVFEAQNDIDVIALENERCGICMDIVIDRGVLDCCNHWFCFACIDNWASITNLCPLCKNEFQMITCVPVYDTIGSTIVEEDSLSRDDDWCIQGKNSTLSFPSYYINEDAVICLDGDGCKIRSGLAGTEEDLNLDTSIACDSCDLWYHAFCVEFDAESTNQNSWLCPRCVLDEVPNNLDGVSIRGPSEKCGNENADTECSTEVCFSGKVMVSVADAGETAVVVSMVEGKQWTESSDYFQSDAEDEKSETDSGLDTDTVKLEVQPNGNFNSLIQEQEKTAKAHTLDIDEHEKSLTLSLSQDNSSLPSDSLGVCELKNNDVNLLSDSDGCKDSAPLLDTFCTVERLESECNIDLQLSLCVDKMNGDTSENALAGHQQSSVEYSLSVEDMAIDANENLVGAAQWKSLEDVGMKRKNTDKSRDDGLANACVKHEERDAESEVPIKKPKSDLKSQMTSLKPLVSTSSDGSQVISKLPTHSKSQMTSLKPLVNTSSDGSQVISKLPTHSKDRIKQIPQKKVTTPDIMSIVQGTDHRSSKVATHRQSVNTCNKGGDNVTGLRVKKILHRVVDDESSSLLQKLRKEIREAVRDKTSNDFSENGIFDAKLLTAFRAVIARPESEQVKKVNPSVVRAKKMMLQKGKTRESLTKKIYGTSSGRRRRTWDRDWEVEFWKHRCMKTHPQKVETLQSVLALLKRNPNSFMESSEVKRGRGEVASNSILSRLYLADTSVLPRKDDIKPVSALNHEKNEEHGSNNASVKVNHLVHENHMVATSKTVSDTKQIGNIPSFKGKTDNIGAHPADPARGPASSSMSSGSKVKVQTMKENLHKSDDVKVDKRKWALEVLARKTATVNKDATQREEKDNVSKGNYPLLSQLPTDMRPVLASSRHNKIPVAVRKAQLYRLTEQYLRKTNLPVMHRTADTELAVADAINVEKDICDKSNSKLVYVNLCAQMISQLTGNLKPKRTETAASCPKADSDNGLEHTVNEASNPATACEDVEEALKRAGLLSDSPPNSPYRLENRLNNEDDNEMKGPENVFDMASHPELDIYGDFEYDLEYSDCADTTNMARGSRVSKFHPEDGDLKMKVVLSTVNYPKAFNALDSRDDTMKHLNSGNEGANENEKSRTLETLKDSPSLPECQNNIDMQRSSLKVKTDTQCLSPRPERDEELSLECEELYGPDKEPLVNKFYDKSSSKPIICTENDATAENAIPAGNENYRSDPVAQVSKFETKCCAEDNLVNGCLPVDHGSSGGENSQNHSLTSENVASEVVKPNAHKQMDIYHSITQKVEAYIKEHIRPLCKSGVITTKQYRWAVEKTTDKVMKYHYKEKNANFLIKEGDKVKKLAGQYVEASQHNK